MSIFWRSYSITFETGLPTQNMSRFAFLLLLERYSMNGEFLGNIKLVLQEKTEMDKGVSEVLLYFFRFRTMCTSYAGLNNNRCCKAFRLRERLARHILSRLVFTVSNYGIFIHI